MPLLGGSSAVNGECQMRKEEVVAYFEVSSLEGITGIVSVSTAALRTADDSLTQYRSCNKPATMLGF
jgi:hypothetical protein